MFASEMKIGFHSHMAAPFFDRLWAYYSKVGEVLRGEASAASIFPNSTDVGISREQIYAQFLRQHCPSKCNVLFGGFLFDEKGTESKQLDIIVTNDACPQFNFFGETGKTFACVEGALAAVSVKSMLNKEELIDSLLNIASIPPTASLQNRLSPLVRIANYDDWPYKVIYASNGLNHDTISQHIHEFYAENANIPSNRRPNIIHVAGKYYILRCIGNETFDGRTFEPGTFVPCAVSPDPQAIAWLITGIQQRAIASDHILFKYDFIINELANALLSKTRAC